MIKLLSFFLAVFAALNATAQSNPVKWTYEAKKASDGTYDLVFTAQIQKGWYVYSQYLESDDGPVRTSFNYDANLAVEFQGKNKEEGQRYEGYDDLFGMTISKFSGTPTFTQRVRVKSATTLTGYLEFMTCDEEKCLPPVSQTFSFPLAP